MKYSVFPNNIHLISSFEIIKADFEFVLMALRKQHPDYLGYAVAGMLAWPSISSSPLFFCR